MAKDHNLAIQPQTEDNTIALGLHLQYIRMGTIVTGTNVAMTNVTVQLSPAMATYKWNIVQIERLSQPSILARVSCLLDQTSP